MTDIKQFLREFVREYFISCIRACSDIKVLHMAWSRLCEGYSDVKYFDVLRVMNVSKEQQEDFPEASSSSGDQKRLKGSF
ncbi:MAG: hypothetical protein ACOYKA_04590 [Legionellaceae bacterium]